MRTLKIFSAIIFVAIILFSIDALSSESPGQVRKRKAAPVETAFTKDDVQAEILFGREVAARAIGRYGLDEKPGLMKYVNLLGCSIAVHTARPELEYHFAVLNTEDIGSFAAPGGYVFITRGLLRVLEDESELAGVLAHEIAHIVNRNIVVALHIRAVAEPPSAISLLFGGPFQSVTTLALLHVWNDEHSVDKALDILFDAGYPKQDEYTADIAASYYLVFAGYDPQGLVRSLIKRNSQKGEHAEISGETDFSDRAVRLQSSIEQDGLLGTETNVFKDRFIEIRKTLATTPAEK